MNNYPYETTVRCANCGVFIRYDVPCREYDGVLQKDGRVLCWNCYKALKEEGVAE